MVFLCMFPRTYMTMQPSKLYAIRTFSLPKTMPRQRELDFVYFVPLLFEHSK